MAPRGTKAADVYVLVRADMTEYLSTLKSEGKKGAAGLASEIKQALSDPKGYAGLSPTANFIASIRDGFKTIPQALRGVGVGNIAKELGGVLATEISHGANSGFGALVNIGRTAFAHLKSAAGSIFKGFLVGSGIAGFLGLERIIEKLVSAIPELISRGRDYAETVHTITIETGAGAEESSRLLAAYQFLGGTQADLQQKLNRLTSTLKNHRDAFEALGVATRDSNGNTLNQITLLENLRKRLSVLPDGYQKTQLALLSFGKNGATALGPLLHYLGLTDDQVNKLAADAKNQGLIIGESQIAAADASEHAFNRIQNAISGLAVTLFTDVAPKLTSFFDGLAEKITANAQQIADVLGGVVASIVGLLQGLLGIDLGSFSAQFTNLGRGGSQWAEAVVNDTAELAKLEKQLKPVVSGVNAHNTAIDGSIKKLDAESKSIDKQIAGLKHLDDVQQTVFSRELASLTRIYDAELNLLDAEDKRIARAEQADQDARSAADADRGAAKAKRDLASAQVDLANAQARYNQDIANPDKDPVKQATTLKEGLLAVADAAQKVRDAQQGIADAQQGIADVVQSSADHARSQAEDDRRAQISAVKDYVASIEKIVTDSENKKAALTTLKKREGVLLDEITAAKLAGRTQEATDLETRLAAVRKGEIEEANKVKNAGAVDALTARKDELEKEKAAFQAERQSEGSANRKATLDAIAETKKRLAAAKDALANEAAAHKKLQTEIDEGLITTGTLADGAFEKARLAGIEFAKDIKAAIGSVIDVLLGSQAKGPLHGTGGNVAGGGRSGGLLGALGNITGAFATITSGVKDIVTGMTQFKPEDIALGVMAAGVYFKNPVIIGAGIALYGASKLKLPTGQLSKGGPTGTELPNFVFPGLGFPIPQKAVGGWVGQNGPEIVRVGENRPEFILSGPMLDAMKQVMPQFTPAGTGGGPLEVTVHNYITMPWDNAATDYVSRALAYRRRR